MYYKHHINFLQIKTSTYDPYLLITFKDNLEIKIIRMQINNTLILGYIKFLAKKQVKINKTKFLIKSTQILNPIDSLTFNSCIIIINKESFYMLHKD